MADITKARTKKRAEPIIGTFLEIDPAFLVTLY